MSIEEEYPSGADIERERSYRLRKQLEKEQKLKEATETEADPSDEYLLEYDDLSDYEEEELCDFEEDIEREKKEARQIFMSDKEQAEFPDRLRYCCWRAPRIKNFKYDDSTSDFFNEYPNWEDRVNWFVNEDDDVELQWYPFSYPKDYLDEKFHGAFLNKVSTSSMTSMDCESLFYNPLGIYDVLNTELTEDDTVEDSVDFRLCDPHQVIKDSIQEALEDMEPLERTSHIDIVMRISCSLSKYVHEFIVDVLLFFKEKYPDINVRVSVNGFKPSSPTEIFELGWRYLLFS